MKLKLNENVCKCLALIVLSAIVGMVVYRQTQAKPVRVVEHLESEKNKNLVFMNKDGTKVHKLEKKTPGDAAAWILTTGAGGGAAETSPTSVNLTLGGGELRVIPTDKNNIKYIMAAKGGTSVKAIDVSKSKITAAPAVAFATKVNPGYNVAFTTAGDVYEFDKNAVYKTYAGKKTIKKKKIFSIEALPTAPDMATVFLHVHTYATTTYFILVFCSVQAQARTTTPTNYLVLPIKTTTLSGSSFSSVAKATPVTPQKNPTLSKPHSSLYDIYVNIDRGGVEIKLLTETST